MPLNRTRVSQSRNLIPNNLRQIIFDKTLNETIKANTCFYLYFSLPISSHNFILFLVCSLCYLSFCLLHTNKEKRLSNFVFEIQL